MKLFIINGPNINMLGIREPNIYGNDTYQNLLTLINKMAIDNNIDISTYQSNIEGEIVNFIQAAYYQKADGIIINPAAYTHTSIAILDALKAANLPTVEVHISDIAKREEFRKISYIRDYCFKTITGKGIDGYRLAIEEMIKYLGSK